MNGEGIRDGGDSHGHRDLALRSEVRALRKTSGGAMRQQMRGDRANDARGYTHNAQGLLARLKSAEHVVRSHLYAGALP